MADGPAGHVLMVDDNPMSLALVETELRLEGYTVDCAENGLSGLEAAAAVRPDLILLDVLLPDIDGLEVCRRLKADPATETIPIVMITGLRATTLKVRALDVGADDFLTKPFDHAELLARVRASIRLKRAYEWLDRANTELAVRDERMAAEERIKEIVQISADAVIVLDENHHVTRFNRAAEEIFGYPAEEVIGQAMDVLVAPRYLAAHRRHMQAFAADPEPVRRMGAPAMFGLRRDGAEFPAEALVSKQGRRGHLTYTVMIRDITERVRLVETLRHREEQLQELVQQLLRTQEDERRRVAYELHDGIAQTAAGLYQLLDAYAERYRPRREEARASLDRPLRTAQELVRDVRRLIAGLRPTALDEFGLVAAIQIEVEALRADGWNVMVENKLGDERLPPTVETALYRVAQEALTNARRHGQCTRAHVRLWRERGNVHLEVRDWGLGFSPSAARLSAGPGQRVGLASMKERVELLGGRLRLQSRPGAGTRVVAEVPIPGGHTR